MHTPSAGGPSLHSSLQDRKKQIPQVLKQAADMQSISTRLKLQGCAVASETKEQKHGIVPNHMACHGLACPLRKQTGGVSTDLATLMPIKNIPYDCMMEKGTVSSAPRLCRLHAQHWASDPLHALLNQKGTK